MCYMTGAGRTRQNEPDAADLRGALAKAAAEADRLRARAGELLRTAVGEAADRGLTQVEIARAIGRSQPEVSRLIKEYRTRRFRPSSRLGRLLARHRDEVIALGRAHRVSNIRVFGSVARGEDDEHSDIDLLVDLEPEADLFDLAALDIELENLLGHPVDIVPSRMLNRRARHVASEAVPL
jgi:predicted nucleotidyltransferase